MRSSMQGFVFLLALFVCHSDVCVTVAGGGLTSAWSHHPCEGKMVIPGNCRLDFVDVVTGKSEFSLNWEPKSLERQVVSVTFARNGRRIACVDSMMTVRVWNLGTKDPAIEFQSGMESRVGTRIALSPDAEKLASCEGRFHPVLIYESNTGKLLRKLPVRTDDEMRSRFAVRPHLCFSPNGSFVACAASKIHVWNTRTGDEILFDDSQVFFSAFSPDERFLFGYGVTVVDEQGGGMRLHPTQFFWDLKTRRKIQRVIDKEIGGFDGFDHVYGEPFCVTAGPSGLVRLWDLYTGREIARSAKCVQLNSDAIAVFFGPTASRFTNVNKQGVQVHCFSGLPLFLPSPTKRALEDNWALLGDPNPACAYSAFEFFRANPESAKQFLKNPNFEFGSPDRTESTKLLNDMDAGSYAVRDSATRMAKKMTIHIRPFLLEKLMAHPSVELKRRIEDVLELEQEFLDPAELRRLRRMTICP